MPREKRTCSFPGCDRWHKARGYCNGHFMQIWQGRELRPLSRGVSNEYVMLDTHAEIILTGRRGEEVARAQIDKEDLPLVAGYRWWRRGRSYVGGNPLGSRGRSVLLHRLLLGAPDGVDVDHFDGDGRNNRRSNIRLVTHKENMENLKLAADNTSGFRGVTWDKQNEKWRALVQHNGRQFCLGRFDDLVAAGTAAHEARERLYTNHQTRDEPETR